jgi:tetratricopeptide (TPR) repeat protein
LSAVEKILRKVEQDRIRGHDDRALQRLKEALAEQPQEFLLAREAATLCFQLRRGVEGAGILRSALRRCPDARTEILQLAQDEFERTHPLELAELLFDTYLSQPDFEKARDTVRALDAKDLDKLLAKVRAKVQSLRQDTPDGELRQDSRVSGFMLAEVLVLAALGRRSEMADTCDRILDTDRRQTETVGHLCRLELQTAGDCNELRCVLGRCYVSVQDFERAAEQWTAVAADAPARARVLRWLGRGLQSPLLLPVHARMLLLEHQHDTALAVLEELCKGGDGANATVRAVLESVPEAAHATEKLRQLYARVLVGTSDVDRAVRELEDTRQTGGDAAANLLVVDQILVQRPRDVDAVLLRARLSLDLGNHEDAARSFLRALELDPARNTDVRRELEPAYQKAPKSVTLGQMLIGLLVDMQLPNEATENLLRLRQTRQATAAVLYELAVKIASGFGLSAELLMVFVEAAVDLGRSDEARAAVSHYHASPGTRVSDFSLRMETLLRERPELGAALVAVLVDVPLAPALRLALVCSGLAHGDADAMLRELALLVAEEPELRQPALEALNTLLRKRGEHPRALELTAELLLDGSEWGASAEYFARTLRAQPEATDRICRSADRLFTSAGADDGAWRPIVLALLDTKRHRHARDLCHRAAQNVPADRQGFLHLALGCIHLETGQASAATNAFASALRCSDIPLDRVIAELRRTVALDAHLGHARCVLAHALLRVEGNGAEAVALLSEAVRLDQMLVDLVLEALHEHAATLEGYGPALALAGALWLRRGERARGVALLNQALQIAPELGPQILLTLQVEWDRDAENPDTGMALARALLAGKQERRACRLLAELGRRFPPLRAQLVGALETLLATTPMPEAHRVLWDILLVQGDRDAALLRVRRAVEQPGVTAEHRLELLESALQRFPDEAWIVCELAALEIRSGNAPRGETRMRALLEHDGAARDLVLATLAEVGARTTEPLALLEIDTLLASERWLEAQAALARFRTEHEGAADASLARLQILVARGGVEGGAALDLAQQLRQKGDLEEAIDVLRRVTEGAHAHEARLLLASIYVDLGRVSEGKEILATALQSGSGGREAYDFLERLNAQGLQKKIDQLHETSARTPSNLRARLELARLSLLSRDFSAAREALSFPADGPEMEAARRYLLARSYSDADQPHLAAAVTRSIDLVQVADAEMRRNVLFLGARCNEQLGRFGEAHVIYLRLLGEFPDFKAAHERARVTYQLHLHTCLEPRPVVLEKRTNLGPP